MPVSAGRSSICRFKEPTTLLLALDCSDVAVSQTFSRVVGEVVQGTSLRSAGIEVAATRPISLATAVAHTVHEKFAGNIQTYLYTIT